MSNFPTFDPSRLTKAAAAQYSSGSESEEEGSDYLATNVDHSGEGFHDLNPRKRRRVGDTKERAALGIFASDSEDDGPGRHWKKKTLRSKGMSFVSNGATTLDEEPKSKNGGTEEYSDDDDDEDADEGADEDDDEDVGGVGLGFGAPQRGLGFMPARKDEDSDEAEQPDAVRSFARTNFDGGRPLGRGFVPTSAHQPVLQNPEVNNTPSMPKMARPSAFSSAKGAQGKPNPKSFGARMMAKMGYVEGQGLGSDGQGRNVIIEANLRPQGVGLGAVKEKSVKEREEEKRQAKLRGEVIVDSDEEEKKRRKERRKKVASGVIDSNASTPRRQKTRYLTAEDIKKAAPGLHIPEAFAPILDMTGPGNKLLTSTSGLLTPKSGAVPESSEVTEGRRLIRRVHADLSAFSEEWSNLEERKTWVGLDLREQEQHMRDLASDLERLQVFTGIITDELPAATEWSEVITCLQKAVAHIVSTSSDEVADIAVAVIHPFFREPDWVLLQEPARFATELKGLASVLMKSSGAKTVEKWNSMELNETDLYRQHHKATTSYETMMYKLWLPKAMSAIRDWDVYNPTPLLAILDAWIDLLPPFVRAQFLDNIVRKLETAVAEWNPRKKRSHKLPHLWLFQWLPYLPTYHLDPRGTGLVADVRRKFRQLIDVWDYDRGVIPGLEQWQDVLGDQWIPLIMSHVLPSMGKYLRNFRVDPSDQEPYLPMLTGVLKWSDILTPKVLGEVIVAEVFPMWHEKLNEWLELPEANFEEIGAWLEWWRDQVFPEGISNLKSIKAEFARGFHVIEDALEKLL